MHDSRPRCGERVRTGGGRGEADGIAQTWVSNRGLNSDSDGIGVQKPRSDSVESLRCRRSACICLTRCMPVGMLLVLRSIGRRDDDMWSCTLLLELLVGLEISLKMKDVGQQPITGPAEPGPRRYSRHFRR